MRAGHVGAVLERHVATVGLLTAAPGLVTAWHAQPAPCRRSINSRRKVGSAKLVGQHAHLVGSGECLTCSDRMPGEPHGASHAHPMEHAGITHVVAVLHEYLSVDLAQYQWRRPGRTHARMVAARAEQHTDRTVSPKRPGVYGPSPISWAGHQPVGEPRGSGHRPGETARHIGRPPYPDSRPSTSASQQSLAGCLCPVALVGKFRRRGRQAPWARSGVRRR